MSHPLPCVFALALGLVCATGANSASTGSTEIAYPSRPIRLILPFSVGSSVDTVARLVAHSLGVVVGQQVVVDNRAAGAGGIVGSEMVARAPPDGYTVLMSNVAFAVTPALFRKLPYDPLKDFVAVTQLTTLPYLLVASPTLPVGSLQELIALAKAKPGQITFASSGNGTGTHLTGALLKTVAGIDIVHVPYKGFPPLLGDLFAGRVHLAFNTIPSLLPHVRSGKLRPVVITVEQRSSLMPEVPTSAEAGLPRFKSSTWHGVFLPAGTPRNVTSQLNAALVRALGTNEMKERLVAQGAEPVGTTPEQYAVFVRDEIIKWKAVVKTSGATVD